MTPDHSPNQNDAQIDRVLNALRDAIPPTGMDRRILNVLEAETHRSNLSGSVIPSGAKRSRGTPAFSDARTATLFRWTTTAVIAALIIAAAITLTSHRHITQPTTAIAPTPSQPITTATTTTHNTLQRTSTLAHRKPTQSQPTETPQPAEDAQLSHPAPPIPITDQERILLRYTSRGRTEDLAQISNTRTAAKDQQEAADFEAFFTPPEIPIGESE
jgi:hypothetical protein